CWYPGCDLVSCSKRLLQDFSAGSTACTKNYKLHHRPLHCLTQVKDVLSAHRSSDETAIQHGSQVGQMYYDAACQHDRCHGEDDRHGCQALCACWRCHQMTDAIGACGVECNRGASIVFGCGARFLTQF